MTYNVFSGTLNPTHCPLFNKFFPIVNTCLSYADTARQSCAMVPKWRFFAFCIFSEPRACMMQHISDMHYKFAQGHTMCGSMVDIQSAAIEIRRGKKEERKKIETTGQKYNGLPYYI